MCARRASICILGCAEMEGVAPNGDEVYSYCWRYPGCCAKVIDFTTALFMRVFRPSSNGAQYSRIYMHERLSHTEFMIALWLLVFQRAVQPFMCSIIDNNDFARMLNMLLCAPLFDIVYTKCDSSVEFIRCT